MFKVNDVNFISTSQSVLETVINQGYSIPFNCRDGRCRNCELVDYNTGETVLACQIQAIEGSEYICENFSDIVLPKTHNIPVKLISVVVKGNFFEVSLKFSKKINFDYVRGQHITIDFGEFKRSYSIYNIDFLNNYIQLLISPIEKGRATTFFSKKNEGILLRCEIPLGAFYYRTPKHLKERSIFVCTGSGIAPILNIYQEIFDKPDNIFVYWGVKKYCDKVSEVENIFGDLIKIFISDKSHNIGKKIGRVKFEDIPNAESIENWYLVGNPNMISDFYEQLIKLKNKPFIYKDPFV